MVVIWAYRRTLNHVRRQAFWSGWRGSVRRHCKQCQNCNGRFWGQLPRTGPLQPVLAAGQAAKRAKRYYDMRVKPKQYHVGEWVYYFNPRKRPGRQDKWATKYYTGPFLVTKIIGAVNVVIQRSKRAKPITVHVDKLKPFVADEMPRPWLDDPRSDVLVENEFIGGVEPISVEPATDEPETLAKQRLEPALEDTESLDGAGMVAEAEADGGERDTVIT